MSAANKIEAGSAAHSLSRYLRATGMPLLFLASILATLAIHRDFGAFDVQSLALGALPLAMASTAQAIVVISGGIDLSVGSMIAVANVLSASLMQHASFRQSLGLAVLIILVGAMQGAINGTLIVLSRIPDIVVTLTTGFIWGGVALLILERPGGGAPSDFLEIGAGADLSSVLPNALLLLIGAVGVIWVPIRSSRLGLSLYATGSDPVAAFRSGVDPRLARILAYGLGGVFCGIGGVALTMTTGIGAPLAGAYYTLSSVAAVVIGGVSLNGGRGGVLGPVLAALLLTLLPMDLIFLNIDPNYGQVIQGTLIVLVVMIGGFAAFLQGRS